jgi:hypothetical protein
MPLSEFLVPDEFENDKNYEGCPQAAAENPHKKCRTSRGAFLKVRDEVHNFYFLWVDCTLRIDSSERFGRRNLFGRGVSDAG